MSASPFEFAGRVAVVTGAGSGIGRATAQQLAALGAQVVATDIDTAAAQATVAGLGGGAVALHQDVTSEDDWQAVFAHIERNGGRLDALVNNAGVMMNTPFERAPLAQLRRQFSINVESAYIGMQAAIPFMKRSIERHGARPSIVNVSSIYGQVAGPQFAAYSASKGAIKMLSKAVAVELATAGIRVNSIHPGPTQTNLGAAFEPPRDAAGQPVPPEQVRAQWLRLVPMGRLGTVADVAPVIAFLCSDAAQYITGAEIVVDGGYTAV